jgi:Protein of unknown function (DUF1353)
MRLTTDDCSLRAVTRSKNVLTTPPNDITRSRRAFFKSIASIGFGVAGRSLSAEAESNENYADSVAADSWMKKWMSSLNAAVGPLNLGRFADRMYFLLKEIEWTPETGQKVNGVRVPIGFVTDFASIPRVFWSILPPDGLYTYPAILHDYLYWEQTGTRAEADLTLRYAMEEFKVDRLKMETIYAGVRAGGEVAWRENASLKRAGEKRVLKQFPSDPTISWGDWKKRPVF